MQRDKNRAPLGSIKEQDFHPIQKPKSNSVSSHTVIKQALSLLVFATKFSPVPYDTFKVYTAMTKTANGTFDRVAANRITAIFVVDGIQRTFNATVSPSLQPFTSNDAKLLFTGENDLTSTRFYSGAIGMNTFKLTVDNGPVIEGTTNVPGIASASTVNGSGT